MIFKNVVSIDAHFQNSINIGLDLHDSEKVNSYIPTSTGINFLDFFIEKIINENSDHSSMLIAPYGKGKSHAVLVLLSLLMSTDFSKYKKLLDKIKEIDSDLFNKILLIKDKKFLPVVVSHTRGSLNQSLLLSLQKALYKADIKEIILDTDFHQVYNRVDDWKLNYPDTYSQFIKKLHERNISYVKFIDAIHSFDEESLKLFKSIHKEILSGAEYISKNTLEIVDYYQQVADKLKKEFNYDGIYIVFDEFSKFLESRDERTVSNDMKIIQDLAELCNNSSNPQMHLQLILHKPISDYLSLDKQIRNAFKGIEGRVYSYHFISDLKNSFDLVSCVIKKKENYEKIRLKNASLSEAILRSIGNLPVFSGEFPKSYLEKQIIDDCYPLHPITTYLLIKINERVAQNERTLFTFLAKKTKNSLINIIEAEYDYSYILPSVVFDYFEELLLSDKDDFNLQKTASKAVSALNNTDSRKEQEFIKTLALLMIINEKDFMPTNISVLSAAMMLEQEECSRIVEQLISRDVLVKRHDGQIQFKINMDLNLESTINNIITTRFSKVNIEKELFNVTDNKYFYPRTYNIKNSITRFFKIEYISSKDFISLSDVDLYFDDNVNDGLILNVVRDENDQSDEIMNHVKEIDNKRLVVVYPTKYTDYLNPLKRLLANKFLLEDTSFIENNILLKTELELMYDDLKKEIKEKMDNDFSFSIGNNHIYNTYNNGELTEKKRLLSKNRILGEILTDVFYQYPNNINLELINKNFVKGVYKKARENVIDKILNNSIEKKQLGTSPESTIINCLLIETGIFEGEANDKIKEILSEIKQFFNSNSLDFSELYKKLMGTPYGLRKGVIPIFIAFVISQMPQCVLLTHKGQEIELNAASIEAMNEKPKDFSFKIDEINASKLKYLEDLSIIFDCDLTSNMAKNYRLLTHSILKWFIYLPKFTKQMIGIDNDLNNKQLKILRKKLNQSHINASEFILIDIPKMVETTEYDQVISHFKELKDKLDSFIHEYLIKLKHEINTILGFVNTTIVNQSVNFWIDRNEGTLNKKILDEDIKSFIETSKSLKNSTEEDFVNRIAYCFTSLFVEDWSDKTHELFISKFEKLKDFEVSINDDIESNQITLKLNGKTIVKKLSDDFDDSTGLIEEFIENTIEDYGDVLTNEQKIALLVKIMQKYL